MKSTLKNASILLLASLILSSCQQEEAETPTLKISQDNVAQIRILNYDANDGDEPYLLKESDSQDDFTLVFEAIESLEILEEKGDSLGINLKLDVVYENDTSETLIIEGRALEFRGDSYYIDDIDGKLKKLFNAIDVDKQEVTKNGEKWEESESSSEPSSSVAPPASSSTPPASSKPPTSSSTPPAPVYFNTSDLNVFNQESIDARIFEGVMVHLNEDDLIEDFVAELKNIFKSLEIITLNETQKAKYNSTEPWVYGADIITSDLSSIIYLYDDFAAFKHADTVQFIKFPSGKMGELETIIGRYATAVHNRDEIKNNPDNPDIMTGGENQNESEDSSEQVDVMIGGTHG